MSQSNDKLIYVTLSNTANHNTGAWGEGTLRKLLQDHGIALAPAEPHASLVTINYIETTFLHKPHSSTISQHLVDFKNRTSAQDCTRLVYVLQLRRPWNVGLHKVYLSPSRRNPPSTAHLADKTSQL